MGFQPFPFSDAGSKLGPNGYLAFGLLTADVGNVFVGQPKKYWKKD